MKIIQWWQFQCGDKWTPVSITKFDWEVKIRLMQKYSKSVACVSVLGSVDTIHSYGYTEDLFLLTWYVALDYGFDELFDLF